VIRWTASGFKDRIARLCVRQRDVADGIESEALHAQVNIFPALNALGGNRRAAGNHRHVDADGCQMGD